MTNTTKQELLIPEEHYITPLTEILEAANPTNSQAKTTDIQSSLNTLFPEQKHEEKRIQKAKEILGSLASEFTPPQLQDIVTEVQFLADTWLDDFERSLFNGETIRELLHERGGR